MKNKKKPFARLVRDIKLITNRTDKQRRLLTKRIKKVMKDIQKERNHSPEN